MPLSGDAKKKYQQDYMRRKRGSNSQKGSNTQGLTNGSNSNSVNPRKPENPVIEKLAIARQAIESIKENKPVTPDIPWFNPLTDQRGTSKIYKFRDLSGNVYIGKIPDLDADGNPIPYESNESTTVAFTGIVRNLSKEFYPNPKPVKRRK